MRGFFRYSAIAFALIAVVGCEQHEQPTQSVWGDVNVPLDPSQHYIHFDADINTRGALVEGNYLEDDFAVLGYQYRGTWASEKVFATPNVFDNTPQLVEYDGTVFSYGTPKVWTGNKYSFFAYYPSNHDKITLFDNGTSKSGDPYIVYELPISSRPTDLIDVMTASYIDTGVASSASVALQFHHRLCSVDVGARNYYEYNHDNNSETDPKLVTIEISSLTLDLTNIVSTTAKIYLDHTIPTELNYKPTRESISYVMVGSAAWAPNTFDVQPNTASDRAIRLVTTQSGENASSILLLPQTELLHGTVTLTYRKKFTDDDGTIKYQKINTETRVDEDGKEYEYTYYTWTPLPTDTNAHQYYEFKPTLPINFSKELIEGRRYYIELTFTSDAVSVNIVAADEWNFIDKDGDGKSDNIDYEFE